MTIAPDFSRIRPFTVGPHTYDATFLAQGLVFSGDLPGEMAAVAGWIAFWGAVAADAKALYDAKEAAYRGARDKWILARVGSTPKVAKTVAEVEWRTQAEYPRWQREIQDAERAWNTAGYVYEAHLRRSNVLVSMARSFTDERWAGRWPKQGDPR